MNEPSMENSNNPPETVSMGDASGDLQTTVMALESNLREANERILRGQAELENYRKRMRREMEEDRRYAVLPLVQELLSVVDNVQRAIDAASQAPDATGLLEGVKMVNAQFQGVLKNHNCVPIETVGQPFDPNFHQAIAQEASTEFPSGTVSRCAQVGYKLHDRVVRPAQVFVSTGSP